MRTIVHISDLHFGSIDPAVLAPLAEAVIAAKPHLVVVSGDLTQRARRSQFKVAAGFLRTLPVPQIIVPGNHDVPLYNVLARWLTPLDNFRRYVTGDLQPSYRDEEIAVVGVNTARSWSFKEGRINREQVTKACGHLRSSPDRVVRMVVTHHPFVTPEETNHGIIGRAEMAMTGFSECRLDVILSGHLHVSDTTSSVAQYGSGRRSIILVQAGTATSSRRRDEPNAFNVIRTEDRRISVERMAWHAEEGGFRGAGTQHFVESPAGWFAADG